MKKIITLILFLLITLNTKAQNETKVKKPFSISGSGDVYFRTNLTGPDKAIDNESGESYFLHPGTSFANRNGFSIGMANIIASYEGKKVGAVADLVLGPRGEDAVFLSSPSTNIINQLYVYWNVSETLKLTLGNFNTFLGYEVISPSGNFNYSTSYMFSNGPFSHTGFKADINLSEKFTLMLAIMNSTDHTETNIDGSYTLGGQIGYQDQFLNIIYGEQTGIHGTTFQIDYTGGFNLSKKIFLGINSTYNDTEGSGFYGAALYPQFSATKNLAIGIRGEYFGYHTDVDSIDNESVIAATLSANYSIGNLTIIPELRFDTWSYDAYVDHNLIPSEYLGSFLLATVYTFN